MPSKLPEPEGCSIGTDRHSEHGACVVPQGLTAISFYFLCRPLQRSMGPPPGGKVCFRACPRTGVPYYPRGGHSSTSTPGAGKTSKSPPGA